MNEAEFIVRRIIKDADAWSKEQLASKQNAPTGTSLYYLNKRAAQVELIEHIINQFIGKEQNDK